MYNINFITLPLCLCWYKINTLWNSCILAIAEEHIHMLRKCVCHILCLSILLNFLIQLIS
jgi:hypothetical protein